ncbi:MAG: hypothetical protein AAGA48_35060 [Myxococcota bacterium]
MSLMDVLDDIRKEVDGCYFALCFELESSLTLGVSTDRFASDADRISAAFGEVMGIVTDGQRRGRNDAIREALNQFKELILETDISTFFVRAPAHSKRFAVAVGVPKGVKIGFARTAIDRHNRSLIESIQGIS